MFRVSPVAVVAVLAAAGALARGAAPAGGEPLGPFFGNNAYEGEVRDEGVPDEDDFVGPLAAGERLSVSVAALPGSALLPGLRVLDPSGADRTPPLRAGSGGRRASFRRLAADASGRWVVRVSGREGSEGGYRVRFRVGPSRPSRLRLRLLPGGGAREEEVPFPAVRGSRLALRLEEPGGRPPRLAVLDPAGTPHPLVPFLLERRGGAWFLPDLPLDSGDGTWRLLVGVDDEPVRLSLRTTLPDRPRGAAVLDPREPRLEERTEPLEGVSGGLVRIRGSGFAVDEPPVVLVAGRPAEVAAQGAAGERLDVLLPGLPPGEPVEVAVVNPDGQACAAPGYLRVAAPAGPAVRGFVPESLRIPAGGCAEVAVLLAGHAPAGGATVLLEAEGGVGTVPPSVRVEPFALHATFPFEAAGERGEGRLRAALGGEVFLPVEVTEPPPPDSLDLTGWRLVQTSASRTWTLPEGTAVRRGGALVVARDATREAFEGFWGPLPGSAVAYVDSGGGFPSLNGAETLSLLRPDGSVADGPTVALTVGRAYRRVPGTPAGEPGSWQEEDALPGTVHPGGPTPAAAGPAGVHLARFADPSGTGRYVFEFVEIRWDGTGP